MGVTTTRAGARRRAEETGRTPAMRGDQRGCCDCWRPLSSEQCSPSAPPHHRPRPPPPPPQPPPPPATTQRPPTPLGKAVPPAAAIYLKERSRAQHVSDCARFARQARSVWTTEGPPLGYAGGGHVVARAAECRPCELLLRVSLARRQTRGATAVTSQLEAICRAWTH